MIRLIRIVLAFLIIFSVLFSSCSNSEPVETPMLSIEFSSTPPGNPFPYISGMNTGSSKRLEGKCLFVNIFFTDSDSYIRSSSGTWSIHLSEAFKFLTDSAAKYNREFLPIYNEPDIMLNYTVDFSIPDSFDGSEWEMEVFNRLYVQYDLDSILKNYDADNVSYIYHINKVGTSYALPGFSQNAPEIAVCYAWYNDDSIDLPMKPGMYAREVMHLYGAVPMYNLKDYRASLAREFFSYDIMFDDPKLYDFEYFTAFDVTAYSVGWQDELDEKYHLFIE